MKKKLTVLLTVFSIFSACMREDTQPMDSDLESKICMQFPRDTQILNRSDGGGRLEGFYEWLIFSKDEFKMPAMKQPGVTDYLRMPLESSVEFIESRMKFGKKIKNPESAFASRWENEEYTFRGTMVNASGGSYLLVSRFKNKH